MNGGDLSQGVTDTRTSRTSRSTRLWGFSGAPERIVGIDPLIWRSAGLTSSREPGYRIADIPKSKIGRVRASTDGNLRKPTESRESVSHFCTSVTDVDARKPRDLRRNTRFSRVFEGLSILLKVGIPTVLCDAGWGVAGATNLTNMTHVPSNPRHPESRRPGSQR